MSDLLSSWSRRRKAVAAEAEQEARAAADAEQARQQQELAEKSDAEILEELGLPDPDSLGAGDDFKAFMAKSVPQHLRQRALRKLWRSNPVLACVDGLNDYDDDYLAQGIGQGAIKTTYQVGKGMLRHLMASETAKDAASPIVHADDPVAEAAVDSTEEPQSTANAEVRTTTAPQSVEDRDEAPLAAPRRMQFQFEDDMV